MARRNLPAANESRSRPPAMIESKRAQLLDLLAKCSVCRGSFTLASGAKSDLYVDVKLTALDPQGALLIGEVGWDLLVRQSDALGVKIDGVGGLTMGADPIALSIGIAAQLNCSGSAPKVFCVRKSPKTHGRSKLIEGNFQTGDRVVVIDDVITTGGSTLQAIEAIESEGGVVLFALAVVDRDEGGRQNIADRGFNVVSIFNRQDVIAARERHERQTINAAAHR
jgi:orotate phosphoribosyltransferase